MSALSQFFGGSIKRIQRGTITVPNNTTTATITLPFAVDPNKSILSLLGSNTAWVNDSIIGVSRTAYLELTNSGTTLTASGAATQVFSTGSSATTLTIAWQIVEYN